MAKSKPNPPTALTILKVRRTRRHVVISYTNGEEEHNVKSRDNPLPAFDKAIEALAPLTLELLHLPDTYSTNLRATGLTIADAGGNEQVTIIAQKHLDEANGPFNIATPLRLLDEPTKEGAVGKPLNDDQLALVQEVIEQAKAYIRGDRAQGQIPLGDDEDDGEGEDTETKENASDKTAELPLAAPEMAHNQPAAEKPKRGRKSKADKEAAAAGK